MKNNTVVTIGDINYLWGIFMLIASMRKNGMDEPVIVGTKNFTPEAENILHQLGDVKCVPLTAVSRSLTCYKAEVMLQAETEFVTWVDSDGFFVGNCSKLLAPDSADEIHIRMRSAEENPLAFRNYLEYGEDGRTIPAHILQEWQKNINDRTTPANPCSCSACFLSLHRKSRPFLEKWDSEMKRILPASNVGVVDKSLKYYHQLDESVLNSVLCFWSNAPGVAPCFKLDKDLEHLFVHFVGMPKPWQGWPPEAIRHFDKYVEVAEFALAKGWALPSALPYSLKRSNYLLCRVIARPLRFVHRLKRYIKRKVCR